MAKYGYKFKKRLVLEYLKNRGSYRYISQKYGMSDDSQLKSWVAAYKRFGDEGLKRSRSHKFY
uniref:transposase n=1 Tax=Acidaminococcus timonensis TaxID=1871002 RepID=UPI0026EF8548